MAKNKDEKIETKPMMEILEEVRQKRNSELTNRGRTDISVEMVEFFGKGEQTGKDIIRLIEKQEFEDKPAQFLEKFYLVEDGNPELVAVKNPETDEILPVGIEENARQSWDVEKDDIEKCIEEREKQLEAIAQELGIDKEEIKNLSEIDLEQKVQERMQERPEEEKEEEQKEDGVEELSEKEAESISAGNEIRLDTQIDSRGTTLGKELDMNDYTKIMVVHSYKLTQMTDVNGNKGKRGEMKMGFIAQKKDGTYETVPETKLRMYRGDNKEVTAIRNPQEIETKNNDSIYEISGTNKKLSIRQTDPYGIPEVYLASSTRDNDKNMGERLQDKYDGTDRTDVEVRQLFNSNKGEYQADKMVDEAESHEKADCDEDRLSVENVDGDRNTGHQHDVVMQIRNMGTDLHNEIINRIKESCGISREDEAERYLNEVVEDMTENEKNELQEKPKEEIIEEINNQAQEIAEQEYRSPSDNRGTH